MSTSYFVLDKILNNSISIFIIKARPFRLTISYVYSMFFFTRAWQYLVVRRTIKSMNRDDK